MRYGIYLYGVYKPRALLPNGRQKNDPRMGIQRRRPVLSKEELHSGRDTGVLILGLIYPRYFYFPNCALPEASLRPRAPAKARRITILLLFGCPDF